MSSNARSLRCENRSFLALALLVVCIHIARTDRYIRSYTRRPVLAVKSFCAFAAAGQRGVGSPRLADLHKSGCLPKCRAIEPLLDAQMPMPMLQHDDKHLSARADEVLQRLQRR